MHLVKFGQLVENHWFLSKIVISRVGGEEGTERPTDIGGLEVGVGGGGGEGEEGGREGVVEGKRVREGEGGVERRRGGEEGWKGELIAYELHPSGQENKR